MGITIVTGEDDVGTPEWIRLEPRIKELVWAAWKASAYDTYDAYEGSGREAPQTWKAAFEESARRRFELWWKEQQ